MARTFARLGLTPGFPCGRKVVSAPMVRLGDNPSSWGSLSDG